MSQTIDVRLTVIGDKDVLSFDIDKDNPEKYVINLNSESNQDDIKSVFIKLLELLMEDDISLNYKFEKEYNKKLFIEVCGEYISDLNQELISVREELKKI